jgi:hypothetical protein
MLRVGASWRFEWAGEGGVVQDIGKSTRGSAEAGELVRPDRGYIGVETLAATARTAGHRSQVC